MEYRSEIDGLRAVAVVPVILFHAGVAGFAGGYVGVDVFFVISGYLITTLLLGDLGKGRFHIGDFYARRARRILPALVAVIAACIPLAWVWLPPNRLESFAESVSAVGLFVSNLHFAAQEGYFAAAAEEQPLLHTWSLAVEEQYYVLFPLLLALVWRFARRWVPHVLAGAAVLSFGAAALADRAEGTGLFFQPHLRAWELLIGSLAAVVLLRRGRLEGRAGEAAAGAGLVLIAIATVAYDAATPFPGPATLLPTVGAALFIAGASSATGLGRLLSARAVVWVGLLSYSAYLWHFPLFAFARVRFRDEPPMAVFALLIALTFALAWLSWRYVEQPFRNPQLVPRRQALAFGGAVSVSLVVLGLLGQVTGGFPHRLDRQERAIYDQLLLATEEKRFDDGACRFSTEDVSETFAARFDACSRQHGPAVLVTGDSHATDLFNAMARNASVPFVVGITRGYCRLHEHRSDCHYDDVHRFVEERPGAVRGLLYTQKGSYLLTGYDRLPVEEAHVAAVQDWLRSFEAPGAVIWVGPQIEPYVDIRNLNPLVHKVGPSDHRRELAAIRDLDAHLVTANAAASIHYSSKVQLVDYRFERDFLRPDGYTYSDTDHWSALGEEVFGSRLLKDPALAQLLISQA